MGIYWSDVESSYVSNAEKHWRACEASGLVCPFDVFEQLFHDHHEDRDFARDLTRVDWSRVVWEERLLSGVRLRQVAVPRGYQYAVDEARADTLLHGLQDDREEVIASWRESGSWVRSPVLMEGEVLGLTIGLELHVGFTRLGDLYGMLDRREVGEIGVHRVWLGVLRTDP
jgi:hypothetical protein